MAARFWGLLFASSGAWAAADCASVRAGWRAGAVRASPDGDDEAAERVAPRASVARGLPEAAAEVDFERALSDEALWAAADDLCFVVASLSLDAEAGEPVDPPEERCVDDGFPDASFGPGVFAVGLCEAFAEASGRAFVPEASDPAGEAPDVVPAAWAAAFEPLFAFSADADAPSLFAPAEAVFALEALVGFADLLLLASDAEFLPAEFLPAESWPAVFLLAESLLEDVSFFAPEASFVDPEDLALAVCSSDEDCADGAPFCLDVPARLDPSESEAAAPDAAGLRRASAESTLSKVPPAAGASDSTLGSSGGAGAEEGANGMAGGCIEW